MNVLAIFSKMGSVLNLLIRSQISLKNKAFLIANQQFRNTTLKCTSVQRTFFFLFVNDLIFESLCDNLMNDLFVYIRTFLTNEHVK